MNVNEEVKLNGFLKNKKTKNRLHCENQLFHAFVETFDDVAEVYSIGIISKLF